MALERFGHYTTNVIQLEWAISMLTRRSAELEEPVSEAELRQQIRCDPATPADYVQRLGRVAREMTELYCQRAWIEQQLEVSCQVIRSILPLPLAFPLRRIDAVTYLDEDGQAQPIASYRLTCESYPPSVDLTGAPDSLHYSVLYTAGLDIGPPEPVRHGILSTAAWLFTNYGGELPDPRILAQRGLPPVARIVLDPYRLETMSL